LGCLDSGPHSEVIMRNSSIKSNLICRMRWNRGGQVHCACEGEAPNAGEMATFRE